MDERQHDQDVAEHAIMDDVTSNTTTKTRTTTSCYVNDNITNYGFALSNDDIPNTVNDSCGIGPQADV